MIALWLMGALTVGALIFLFFAPSYVAYSRDHRNATPIIILNIFLGWTFVGWVVALVWSFSDNVPPPRPSAPKRPSEEPTVRSENDRVICPQCRELTNARIESCLHCGSDLADVARQ